MLLAILAIATFAMGTFLVVTAVVGNASSKQSREMLARKDEILDQTFNGSDHVTVLAGLAHLPHDVVITGADERGYATLSDTEAHGIHTLVFKRR